MDRLSSPTYTIDTNKWLKDIQSFTTNCNFRKLEILEDNPLGDKAFVTFKAIIFCNDEDCSFIEKSKFLKENEKWFYLSGVFL